MVFPYLSLKVQEVQRVLYLLACIGLTLLNGVCDSGLPNYAGIILGIIGKASIIRIIGNFLRTFFTI